MISVLLEVMQPELSMVWAVIPRPLSTISRLPALSKMTVRGEVMSPLTLVAVQPGAVIPGYCVEGTPAQDVGTEWPVCVATLEAELVVGAVVGERVDVANVVDGALVLMLDAVLDEFPTTMFARIQVSNKGLRAAPISCCHFPKLS